MRQKRVSRIARAVMFFLIAAGTGIASNLLAGYLLRESSGRVLDVSRLVGLRQQLNVTERILDRDANGIPDTANVEVTGPPGVALNLYLYDVSEIGEFTGSIVNFDDEKSGEAIFRLNHDKDGRTIFRLPNRLEATDVTYYYADLDRNGRIDMVTLYKDGKPGWGYILNRLQWLEFKKVLTDDGRRVQMIDESGTAAEAVFKDGQWEVPTSIRQ